MAITITAPAKVNLHLRVGKKRPDGFHDIDSLFAAVDLHDRIEVEKTNGAPEIICPGVPISENIGWKVIDVFRSVYGVEPKVKIRIRKQIPIGRGLGGGSSDAAAILIGLSRLYDIDVEEAKGLAPLVGSDVSFFFQGGLARVMGRGEVVKPLPFKNFHLTIISPPFPISTAWAYQQIDGRGSYSELNYDELPSSDPKDWVNDFEPVVFDHYPILNKIKSWLMEKGALLALLSGSGSAVFGICDRKIPGSPPFPGFQLYTTQTIEWGVV